VKLSAGRISGFIRSPDPKLRLILLFGADRGLVRERAEALARTAVDDLDDPFRVTRLAVENVRGDAARVMDELGQMSLLGGRRVVFLKMEAEDLSSALAGPLESPPPGDNLLIVEAGELTGRSPVRKLFEDSAVGVALPCYGDDAEQVTTLVEQTFAGLKVRLDPAARDYLVSQLGADRGVTRSELEKIALYAKGKSDFTLADATSLVGDSAAITLDKAIFAAAEGDGETLDTAVLRALRDDGPIALLRVALRHFHRLHLAAGDMARGRTPEEAVKALRPPVLFFNEGNFRRQLRLWSTDRLRGALAILAEAERDCKSTGLPDEALAHRALMRICIAARRSR